MKRNFEWPAKVWMDSKPDFRSKVLEGKCIGISRWFTDSFGGYYQLELPFTKLELITHALLLCNKLGVSFKHVFGFDWWDTPTSEYIAYASVILACVCKINTPLTNYVLVCAHNKCIDNGPMSPWNIPDLEARIKIGSLDHKNPNHLGLTPQEFNTFITDIAEASRQLYPWQPHLNSDSNNPISVSQYHMPHFRNDDPSYVVVKASNKLVHKVNSTGSDIFMIKLEMLHNVSMIKHLMY
jgi:hypothetical protein